MRRRSSAAILPAPAARSRAAAGAGLLTARHSSSDRTSCRSRPMTGIGVMLLAAPGRTCLRDHRGGGRSRRLRRGPLSCCRCSMRCTVRRSGPVTAISTRCPPSSARPAKSSSATCRWFDGSHTMPVILALRAPIALKAPWQRPYAVWLLCICCRDTRVLPALRGLRRVVVHAFLLPATLPLLALTAAVAVVPIERPPGLPVAIRGGVRDCACRLSIPDCDSS